MKIIATDLDRTLMPNGNHVLSKGAMQRFAKELKKNKVRLIYVSGRYERLIYDGMKRYNLPKPNYCVANVGTTVFSYKNGELINDKNWQAKLAADWQNYRREDIRDILRPIKYLKEQELVKLNEFKESYYVDIKIDKKFILDKIKEMLQTKKVRAELIYSVDINRNIGLVDFLPK